MGYIGEFSECKKCKKFISRYTIDREIGNTDIVRTYKITFCWGCGYFSIYPNIRDEFTTSIMRNRFLIIDLIKDKHLKPIL